MKTIEETLLNRTSVRRYEYDKIPSETLDFIYRAIANTPTSYNGQQFSVIAIDDQSIKEELYAITNQKQIKTCATLLVFCADYHKIGNRQSSFREYARRRYGRNHRCCPSHAECGSSSPSRRTR